VAGLCPRCLNYLMMVVKLDPGRITAIANARRATREDGGGKLE